MFYPETCNRMQINLDLVVYGIYGLWTLRQKPHARSRAIPYCGLIGVGVCSGGYHMTLKYHTQMCMSLSFRCVYLFIYTVTSG